MDLCTHPVCLLAVTGGYIDPDDAVTLHKRLSARGFSPAEQDEIAHELRWAWIEQSLALKHYLKSGTWEGPACDLHDVKAIGDTFRPSKRQRLCGSAAAAAAAGKKPLAGDSLTVYDQSRLAAAAEGVVLSARLDSGYLSESNDKADPPKRASEDVPSTSSPSTPASHAST